MALTDNLVSVWKLDGNAQDAVGGYNLTTLGSVSFTAGKDGSSADFTNGTFYLNAPYINFGTNNFSMTLWMKPHDFEGTYGIISFVGDGTRYVRLYHDLATKGKLRAIAGVYSGCTNGVFDKTVTLNEWNFVAVRYRVPASSYILEYSINGGAWSYNQSYANCLYPLDINCPSYSVTIGNNSYESSCNLSTYQSFSGEIDEVCVWNRALTDQEVADLYNNGSGLFYDPASSTFNPPTGGIIHSRRLITQM